MCDGRLKTAKEVVFICENYQIVYSNTSKLPFITKLSDYRRMERRNNVPVPIFLFVPSINKKIYRKEKKKAG